MREIQDNALIRCFLCIDFPNGIIKEVARVQELIGKKNFIGKFTELENLHLTLKFLGETEEDKVDKVKDLLKEINFNKFRLKLGNIGIFHVRKDPRIIWIKVLGKEIYELQKNIDDLMEKEGFKREERFMGHLTIARIKYVKDKKGFENHVKNISVKPLEFDLNNFKLIKSELMPQGPIYTELEEYELS
ncbi:MAG: RNA 2',3'-cyclic phosphodiesterase [Nanoarchaeota archaeon]|nr:RNA 2',3'-cyclic phosphodiesterase [Nanoarchaeota archaeon]